MKITRYLLFTALLLLIAIPGYATDLQIGAVLAPLSYVEDDQNVELTYVIENINVLTADNYTSFISIKDAGAQTVYEGEIEGTGLEPFTNDTVSTVLEWKPEFTGRYSLNLRVDFQFDIDLSNNEKEQDFTAIISRDKAITHFFTYLPEIPYCEPVNSQAFMSWSPLLPGDTLQSAYETYEISLESMTWMAWLDCDIDARFLHKGAFIYIDAVDTTITSDSTNGWPVINGEAWLNDMAKRDSTEDRILGSVPESEDESSASTITEEDSSVEQPTVCAVLVSGKIEDDSERSSFTFDLDIMEGNLTKEQLGPRLPASQIQRIGNASSGEICSAIDALKTGYDEIIFYYTGHGNKSWMVTNDPTLQQMSYLTLANKLYETDAENITVIIDACYAGGAEGSFRIPFEFTQKNVTVVMSSMSTKTSYTRRIHTTADGEEIRPGYFSWHFAKCWGDPAAESDGEPGISVAEAFNWVRSVNPMLNSGAMNRVMNPQILINRVVRPEPEAANLVPDADLTITPNSELDSGAEITVEMRSIEFDTFEWDDSDIQYISPKRTWSLGIKNQFSAYNVDLQFQYSFEVDSLETEEGTTIGVVKMDSTGWHVVPSELDTVAKTVTATGVTGFSDWALAVVRDSVATSVAIQSSLPASFGLAQNYPNPFNPSTTIEFALPQAAEVRIDVYDLLGRLSTTIINRAMTAGVHSVEFNAGDLASGVYYYRLTAGDFVSTRKFVLLK